MILINFLQEAFCYIMKQCHILRQEVHWIIINLI